MDSKNSLQQPWHRVGFKMQLHEGAAAEYKKRHDELWPELKELLSSSGIAGYSIFWDEGTNSLFAVLKTTDLALLEELQKNAVMQRWWSYMQDLMECNADNSPVRTDLKEVFYLP